MGTETDFAAIVGESRVSADTATCAGFAVDGVRPHCVVYAASAEQVAEVLRCAASHELAVIPSRNGTKLAIGNPPRRYDVALSLKDMNRVWYYEPDDLVVSVEPGMKFGDLQHFLGRHNLWVPLDPAGGERASVGGLLAANAAGPLRLHFGGPRDMVLGMKIATVDGKVVKTGGRVVKNVAGYDLAKLLIGSYGTLGVIVEATFKLYPRVVERATWLVEPASLATTRSLRRDILRSPLRPLRMTLLNAGAQALLKGEEPGPDRLPGAAGFQVWIEAGGSERVIARYSSELGALGAKLGAPLRRIEDDIAAKIWEPIADFGVWLTREKQVPVILRAAMPIAAAEEFLERAEREAQTENCAVAGIVQLGVGVVELGLVSDRDPRPELIASLRHSATSLGGNLAVTRCPAELKAQIEVWGPPGDDFEVMRKLKAAWDPRNTLSPGRFFGGV
ncbi:MAG TPA: FAD-binding oxidoreductase [Terriglobia bacterium]